MATKTYSVNLGIGLVPLTIIFIILKVTGVVAWSWLWVLAPLWMGFALSMGLVVLIFGFMAVVALLAVMVALLER